jgi:hypothetical protein
MGQLLVRDMNDTFDNMTLSIVKGARLLLHRDPELPTGMSFHTLPILTFPFAEPLADAARSAAAGPLRGIFPRPVEAYTTDNVV